MGYMTICSGAGWVVCMDSGVDTKAYWCLWGHCPLVSGQSWCWGLTTWPLLATDPRRHDQTGQGLGDVSTAAHCTQTATSTFSVLFSSQRSVVLHNKQALPEALVCVCLHADLERGRKTDFFNLEKIKCTSSSFLSPSLCCSCTCWWHWYAWTVPGKFPIIKRNEAIYRSRMVVMRKLQVTYWQFHIKKESSETYRKESKALEGYDIALEILKTQNNNETW